MSEDIKEMPAKMLPEANSDTGAKPESAAQLTAQNKVETSRSKRESEEADELKAIAKAFTVHLAWSMAGLLDKKE